MFQSVFTTGFFLVVLLNQGKTAKRNSCVTYIQPNLICTGTNSTTKDYGPEFGLFVMRSERGGFGVFARTPFKFDDYITSFRGFLTEDKDLVSMLLSQVKNNEVPNQFDVQDADGKTVSILNYDEYADGIGRLVNHSRKRPNAYSLTDYEYGKPAVNIYANTNILRGEEILIDYRIVMESIEWLAET